MASLLIHFFHKLLLFFLIAPCTTDYDTMPQLIHTKKFGTKHLLHSKPAVLKELLQHKSLPVVTKDLAHMQMVAAPVLSGMKRGAGEQLSREEMTE
jgi:hypothetical protein